MCKIYLNTKSVSDCPTVLETGRWSARNGHHKKTDQGRYGDSSFSSAGKTRQDEIRVDGERPGLIESFFSVLDAPDNSDSGQS